MKRVIATICAMCLLPSVIAFAATSAKKPPLPHAQALEPQLQKSEAVLLQQRMAIIANQHAQTEQLKARVTELEKQSAANRAAQAQRDRQIAELQRQLDVLQASQGHARAQPAVKTGGH